MKTRSSAGCSQHITRLVVLVAFGIVCLVMYQKGYTPLGASWHAPPSNGVEGGPSLDADFIEHVLHLANSPAQGTGQALSDLSREYGIDDAYALAFFQHESSFGTQGVARVTHSLGNIRCSAGYACIDGFRAYSSWIAGYADWYKLIRNLYINQWGLKTIEQIVPTYAPSSDQNNVAAYIAAVQTAVQAWRQGHA